MVIQSYYTVSDSWSMEIIQAGEKFMFLPIISRDIYIFCSDFAIEAKKTASLGFILSLNFIITNFDGKTSIYPTTPILEELPNSLPP